MKLDSIEDVLANQLADLRSVEAQLLEALPEMMEAADDAKLTRAASPHPTRPADRRTHATTVGWTRSQVERFQQELACKLTLTLGGHAVSVHGAHVTSVRLALESWGLVRGKPLIKSSAHYALEY